jgi:hypothetical protein
MRRRSHLVPKLGVDAVRSDDDIPFRNDPIRKRYPSHIITLLTAGAAVTSVNYVSWQSGG